MGPRRVFAALLLLSLLFLSACGGGGSGEPSLGGGACDAFSARTTVSSPQIFNGESCNSASRTPVVAIIAVARNGERLVAAGICTGTLVTVNDILTSAHCFTEPFISFGDSLAAFVAVVGGEETGELIPISNVAVHPGYNFAVGSRFDIAMATLSRTPEPLIGPVPILISQLTTPGQKMSTFGYGTNNKGDIGILKSAVITIQAISNGNLFAVFDSDNASICAGDSGGPVVQRFEGITALVGVNSFGTFTSGAVCPELPAVYSGFVDIQNLSVLEFISNYAPDVPGL